MSTIYYDTCPLCGNDKTVEAEACRRCRGLPIVDLPESVQTWSHGKVYGYEKHGCRCDECVAAKSAKHALYRETREREHLVAVAEVLIDVDGLEYDPRYPTKDARRFHPWARRVLSSMSPRDRRLLQMLPVDAEEAAA